MRAYFIFSATSDNWFLCHAHTAREAKRLFWRNLLWDDDAVEFCNVRVRRAPTYDSRSALFNKPTFDEGARPWCQRCNLWLCDGVCKEVQ